MPEFNFRSPSFLLDTPRSYRFQVGWLNESTIDHWRDAIDRFAYKVSVALSQLITWLSKGANSSPTSSLLVFTLSRRCKRVTTKLSCLSVFRLPPLIIVLKTPPHAFPRYKHFGRQSFLSTWIGPLDTHCAIRAFKNSHLRQDDFSIQSFQEQGRIEGGRKAQGPTC